MSNTTTTIAGYYNGNRWPIQLVISKLNITLTLEPGKYVLDRQGRKINDPYFEVFANNKQLHREITTSPVPIIAIPEVTAITPAQTSNPVRAVTQWTRDDRGVRQPVLNQPTGGQPTSPSDLPAGVIASASASVQPMSMEEARKRGLVRKVRDVPEDYGVNDTTGLPPGGIPKMRYAIDPGMNKAPAPLPREMLTLPKDDPNNSSRAQLVAGLAQGANTPAPEDASASPFANTSVVNAPPNSPLMAGTPAPLTESAAQPEPEFFAEPDIEPVVAQPAARPATAPVAPPVRPMTPNNQFTCMACGAPHRWRSQLLKHAHQKHPDRINAIMAPYPEVPVLP